MEHGSKHKTNLLFCSDGYYVENLEEIETALGAVELALEDVTVLLIDIAG